MKKLVLISILCVWFSSCKKKDTEHIPVANPPLAPATEYTEPCNGFLTSTYFAQEVGEGEIVSSVLEATASFNEIAATQPDGGSLAVGHAKMNNFELPPRKGPSGKVTYSRSLPADLSRNDWAVDGNIDIPTFHHNNLIPVPTISLSEIPDTIFTNVPILAFSVSNIRWGTVLIAHTGRGSRSLQHSLVNGKNIIKIEPELLGVVEPGSLELTFALDNYDFKVFGGRNFRFSKFVHLKKRVPFSQRNS